MKRIPLALLASILLAPSARATLLVYDGFATETDSQNRTPYQSSANKVALTKPNSTAAAWTTGLDSSHAWSQSSSAVYSFPNNGLSLPDSFADVAGDQFSARGGSAGYQYSASDSTTRAKNRAITSTMPTSGKLYYRCLMSIESAALTELTATKWKYQGTGISAAAANNTYDNGTSLKDAGLRVAFTSTDSSRVDIYINIGGNARQVLQGVSADTTYIAIVELNYDTGKAKAYAAPIADYSTTFTWLVEDHAVGSGAIASAMQVLFIDGMYKSANGKVMFDEIAVGTRLADVAAVDAAPPTLGDVSLARTGAGTYSLTAAMADNGGDLYWVADDGDTTPSQHLLLANAAPGDIATATLAGLSPNKTYRISVLAQNGDGSDEKYMGTLYTGALALGATTNARERDLIPGGVAVSRAAASPWPLTVNYAISGSAGSEGMTWVAPVTVTIPADESSAILPVVPLSDPLVDENITITVALAAGNYEIPTSNAARLTLVNRERFVPDGFSRKILARPSPATLALLDGSSLADFPALLRLPAEASALLRAADGTDLFVVDENDTPLPFEVDTFAPDGTTFVWVKVPALSADTVLTAFLAGPSNADNDPTEVWTDFAGVWHFAPMCVGTNAVPDATGNGFDAPITNQVASYAGPGGLGAIQSPGVIVAPDYDSALTNGVAKFSASGWFKAPMQSQNFAWYSVAHKKLRITTGPNGENLWNIDKGWYFQMPQTIDSVRLVCTETRDIEVPNVSENWNYFHIVSDGSTVKAYANGSTTAAGTIWYTIKASGTNYQICPVNGCAREYRIRRRAASAKETALEYASVADAEFFGYSDVVKAGRKGSALLLR